MPLQPDLALDIGVFDSGLGGLSVLGALRIALPDARFRYIADSRHAPYGERDPAFVRERSHAIAAQLIQRGARLLVVACNSATATAIDSLRAAWPDVPIVGVEPGVKPAVALTRNGRIGVMGTRMTLTSQRFTALVDREAKDVVVHAQPCDGLAAAIEAGDDVPAPALRESVARHCAPLREADVDTVVLGCTHYPFVRDAIEAELGPGVRIVDTAQAIARQAARRAIECASHPRARDGDGTALRLATTGDREVLRRFAARWLGPEAALSVDDAA